MAKSPIEKALEKQQKEIEKQRREEQQSARKAQLRERASAIVYGAKIINGFRIMDKESETTFQCILEQKNMKR